MKTFAVIVSRGEFNNLVQVATLLLAAVGAGIAVRVFFRDEAIYKICPDGADVMDFSEGYRGREAETRERLARLEFANLPGLFRLIKDTGDARFYACSSSLAICGVEPGDLLPEIDGVRGVTAFILEDVAAADRVLTF
ncbi:MAG: DsrE family protein [Candidatus Rokubacteria bacterium]|nr:DsrE family protein [Candidatus Rokubacteria bacterium]